MRKVLISVLTDPVKIIFSLILIAPQPFIPQSRQGGGQPAFPPEIELYIFMLAWILMMASCVQSLLDENQAGRIEMNDNAGQMEVNNAADNEDDNGDGHGNDESLPTAS